MLAIDDNADIRMLLERVLVMAGFEVETAPGGPEAIELLGSADHPDVIVLDVQMPAMDGWETLQKIRTMTGVQDTPVVMCTVKGSPSNEVRGWLLGCDGYVAKPFDVRELMAMVNAVVLRSAEERESVRQAGLVNAQRLAAMGMP